MKQIGLMTVLFGIGAFAPAAVGVWCDLYWLRHSTAHSTAASLILQMVAALVVAVAGALSYCVGLLPPKPTPVAVVSIRSAITALVSGFVFLALELWLGVGVPRRTPENASIGWALVVLVPIAASRMTIWVLSVGTTDERRY